MKVIAAYLLAMLGGNTNPCADELKHILGSVGVEADDAKIELLLSQVNGKDLAELIAAGRQKLAAMPCAGEAAAAAAVGGHAAASAASPSAAAAEDKEQKIEEESDEDMCFSLFD
ncbi:60S acidic ribosomal protein P2-like [Herrania umbratica]|uniref:60S acidic ribosomal protein P2-like n=1 Tax=Herrania umbratica TaxID=108875 RepID=A0A6J1BBN0_9ROSI|nr:60S acidic ribosomal protein P2-like [Herrania umbratica]